MYLVHVLHFCSPRENGCDAKTTVIKHKLLFYKENDGTYSCPIDNGADEGALFKPLTQGRWVRVQDKAYPQTDGERDAIVKRAKTFEGKKGYCLIFNNCEHLVTYIMKGKRDGRQVGRWYNRNYGTGYYP